MRGAISDGRPYRDRIFVRIFPSDKHSTIMPRRPRAVFPGVAHHITQRGNNRQPVFFSDDDRRFYLDLLSHHATRSGVRVIGYCLMTNHVHLVAVPEREDSFARALRHAHSEYALARNRADGRSGHLWQNRFFSCPLDSSHLMAALRYTDFNPVRAALCLQAWDWRGRALAPTPLSRRPTCC